MRHQLRRPLQPEPRPAGVLGAGVDTLGRITADGAARDWTPAILGTVSGGLFGLAAVCFKGGIQSLGLPNFLVAASATLAAGLGLGVVAGSASDLRWLPVAGLGAVIGVIGARATMPAGTWRARPGIPAAVAVGLCIAFAITLVHHRLSSRYEIKGR